MKKRKKAQEITVTSMKQFEKIMDGYFLDVAMKHHPEDFEELFDVGLFSERDFELGSLPWKSFDDSLKSWKSFDDSLKSW